jgi:hypothetical protein
MHEVAGRCDYGRSNRIYHYCLRNTTMRLSRAQFSCPADLAKMIAQVNSLPTQFHFSFEKLIETSEERQVPIWVLAGEYVLALPDAVQLAMFGSVEVREAQKADSYEYWLNNDAVAQDRIHDFCADHAYPDEIRDKMMSWGAEQIADFLVEMGNYGDEYSYLAQLIENAEESGEAENYSYLQYPRWTGAFAALLRLQEARDFLHTIVELGRNIERQVFEGDDPVDIASQQRKFVARQSENEWRSKRLSRRLLAVEVSIDAGGHIHFEPSQWAKAIDGVDITRVRRCEVCDKVYWAKRRDAFACTKEHAKVRQMRLLRANWKENGDLYKKARKKRVKERKETK